MTEYKWKEEQIKQIGQYRQVFQNMPMAIIVLLHSHDGEEGIDFYLAYCNSVAEVLLNDRKSWIDDEKVQKETDEFLHKVLYSDEMSQRTFYDRQSGNYLDVMAYHEQEYIIVNVKDVSQKVLKEKERFGKSLENRKIEDKKMNQLLEKAQVGLLILEWRYNHVYVVSENQHFREMLNLKLPKNSRVTVGMVERVLHEEDVAGFLEFWSRVVNHSAQQEGIFRCRNEETGEMFWLLIHATSIILSDGARQILLCCTDVSKQKRMEKRLMESQANLDTAVIHAGLHYCNYDIGKRCIYMNAQTSAEYKMDGKLENYPASWFDRGMVHPKDIEIYQKGVEQVNSGVPHVSFQARILNLQSKQYEWKLIKFTTFYNNKGVPSYAIVTEEDAVAFKKLEEQLNFIMRQNGIFSYEINLQEQKLAWQPDHEIDNLLGTIDEKYEKLPDALFSHRIIWEEDWLKCRKMFNALYAGKQDQIEGQLRVWSARQKEYIWHELHFSIIEKEKEVPIRAICTIKDISAQKRKEQIYEEEQRMMSKEDSNILVTTRVNLSKKKIESMETEGVRMPHGMIDNLTNYRTGMLFYFDEIYLSEEDNKDLSCESLLRLYRSGVQSMEKNYIAKMKNSNSYLCNRVTCRMLERPWNGDVIAFFYTRDYTSAYINQLTTDTVMQNDYEMAGIIFTNTRHIHIIKEQYMDEISNNIDREYNEAIQGFCRKFGGDYAEQLYEQIRFETVQEMLKKKTSYAVDFDRSYKGQVRRKQLRFTLSDEEVPCILMTRSDIQDVVEKEMEKQRQLEDALNLAERANGAKSEFLSTISHEIRTPMNIIIGMTELAKEEQDNHAAVMKYIEEIETSSRHLLNLVNNVLDMSKIESGEFSLHPQPYTYQELKKNIKTLITPLCKQKNHTFLTEDYGEHHTVYVDIMRLNQVLFNLLSNAVKYTPDGGKIRLIYKNQMEEKEMLATFIIRDNGIGMSREFQEQMFQPFTQEDNTVVASTQGTGLGLSITKGIVDKMGGRLTVDSEVGKGTSFQVELRVPLAESLEERSEEDRAEQYDFSGRKVLVVEDHSMNQMIIAKLLKNKNAEVVLASDGKQGVEVFTSNAPGTFDVILMDVRMPVMNGLEATEKIRAMDREDAKKIPILAMTANAYDEDREKSSKVGMNGHLVKPIDVKILYRELDRVLS